MNQLKLSIIDANSLPNDLILAMTNCHGEMMREIHQDTHNIKTTIKEK